MFRCQFGMFSGSKICYITSYTEGYYREDKN